MIEQVYYQLEFHIPDFIEAFVLLPGEKYRRKFTGWDGSTLEKQEMNSFNAITRQYLNA